MSTTSPRVTANQLVAYNLRRARELRGLTQLEAAERLAPYVKTQWSKATFSAAERSVAGDRIRHFTADDITAFAAAFDLPPTWFFLPPPSNEWDVREVVSAGADRGVEPRWLALRVLREDEGATVERLAEAGADSATDEERSNLAEWHRRVSLRILERGLAEQGDDARGWAQQLRQMAAFFEHFDVERRQEQGRQIEDAAGRVHWPTYGPGGEAREEQE